MYTAFQKRAVSSQDQLAPITFLIQEVTRNSDKDKKFFWQGTTKTPTGESILDRTVLEKTN